MSDPKNLRDKPISAEIYDAIAIDTSVFVRNGKRLESGLLSSLEQFTKTPIKILISEIVRKELIRQISYDFKSAYDRFASSSKSCIRYKIWDQSTIFDLKKISDTEVDTTKSATQRVDNYIKKINAVVIPADLASIDDVMNRYFSGLAPFAHSGEKKNEFPDAIALSSIENWASENHKKVLAVSQDNGWLTYCSNSKEIDCVDDLQVALSAFQSNIDKIREKLFETIEAAAKNSGSEFVVSIAERLDDVIPEQQFHIRAQSESNFEVNSAEYRLYEIEIHHTPKSEISITEKTQDTVSFTCLASIEIEMDVSVTLFKYDPMYEDDISEGPFDITKRITIECTLLITAINGLFDPITHAMEVELLDLPSYIDIGSISSEFDAIRD